MTVTTAALLARLDELEPHLYALPNLLSLFRAAAHNPGCAALADLLNPVTIFAPSDRIWDDKMLVHCYSDPERLAWFLVPGIHPSHAWLTVVPPSPYTKPTFAAPGTVETFIESGVTYVVLSIRRRPMTLLYPDVVLNRTLAVHTTLDPIGTHKADDSAHSEWQRKEPLYLGPGVDGWSTYKGPSITMSIVDGVKSLRSKMKERREERALERRRSAQ